MPNYQTKHLLAIIILTTYGLISGCSKPDEPIAPTEKAPTPIELIQSDLVNVQTGTLSQGTPFTGTIQPVIQTSVQAQISDTVLSVHSDIGKNVQKGQTLATLNNQDNLSRLAQVNANLLAAKAQAELSHSLMQRKKRLLDQGFISKVEYEQSQLEYRAQQENVKALQANVDIADKASKDAVIRSPISGYVTKRHIDAGQTVNIGQTLFEIVDPSRLEIKANISASNQQQLSIGQSIEFRIQGQADSLQAKITRIAPVVDQLSRNLEFFAEPSQQINRLSIGSFVEGKILQSNAQQGLMIPLRSIQNLQNSPYVWVIREQKAEKVQVKILDTHQQLETALIEGLKPDDQISLVKFQDEDQGRKVIIAQ